MKIDIKKYIPLLITLILIILSLFILKDILVAIISAYVLAFLMRPFYVKLSKKIPKPLASGLSVLVVFLIVIVPIAIVAGVAFQELSERVDSETISDLVSKITNLPYLQNLQIDDLTQRFVSLLVAFLRNATSYIPLIAIYVIILIFGTYYFLIDWDRLNSKIRDYLPLKRKEKFFKEISAATRDIVYGTFLVALIELIFAAVGFWILGIKFALILATLIAIFAFVPGLGPLVVWVPLAIYLFLQESYFSMIGVIVMGLILSVYIDGILRAQISGKRANIHPFMMLIGIIGGIAVFGIFGFIIGPIVLVSTVKLIDELIYDQ